MTLPDERYRALLEAKKFLYELVDPKKTPRVPKNIRRQAYAVLRHFPWDMDLELIAEKIPERYKNLEALKGIE